MSSILTDTILVNWLTAIGTVGAVIVALSVALGAFDKKPKLRIELQRIEGSVEAYWHGITTVGGEITYRQLRIWVYNDGEVESEDCRAKVNVKEPDLKGKDSPIEFGLPVAQLYRLLMNVSTDPAGKRYAIFISPTAEQLSITIPAHGREAYDLCYHSSGQPDCQLYSPMTFPLKANVEYVLTITAFGKATKPTEAMTFIFKWDGHEDTLSKAIKPALKGS